MELEKKYNPLYIVAIILLGIYTVWLLNYYRGMLHWRFILEQASYIVLILCILSRKSDFLTVGAFLRVLTELIGTISAFQFLKMLGKVDFQVISASGVVLSVLSPIVWGLFAVSALKREKAISLCTAGAIVYSMGVVVTGYGLKAMLRHGMVIAFLILCGILLQKSSIFTTFTTKGKNIPKAADLSANPYEKIMKLKELLDSDIITQEEFDEKKKQILGL